MCVCESVVIKIRLPTYDKTIFGAHKKDIITYESCRMYSPTHEYSTDTVNNEERKKRGNRVKVCVEDPIKMVHI